MFSFSMRRFRSGATTLLAATAALTVVLPAAPANAVGCGPVVPCLGTVVPTDIFGDIAGVTCGGVFTWVGDEGTREYWAGYILGATIVHSDVQTRRISITCSVRDGSTHTTGTERGATTASSVAPLNFMASATGRDIDYWATPEPTSERLFLCTTVNWTDRAGLPHTYRHDRDPNTAGLQCGEILPVVPSV